MEGEVDIVTLGIAAMAIFVVALIVRAVRAANASIAAASRRSNLENAGAVASVVGRMREGHGPCPRCGGETVALLGTENRYKCEDCDAEFDGAPHIPEPRR